MPQIILDGYRYRGAEAHISGCPCAQITIHTRIFEVRDLVEWTRSQTNGLTVMPCLSATSGTQRPARVHPTSESAVWAQEDCPDCHGTASMCSGWDLGPEECECECVEETQAALACLVDVLRYVAQTIRPSSLQQEVA